jgi:phage shock protein C
VKRLERSRNDRVLLGVCGGFGEYFGIDGDLVRILWILSVVAGGLGIVPYVAAYLLMPESQAPSDAPSPDRLAKNVGLGLVALGGVVFFRQIGIGFADVFGFWNWRVLGPLALFVMGVFLVWPRTRGAVGLSKDRRLHRSVSNRVLAGVAGGLAEDVSLDANLVRLIFVVAAVVTSGLAILAYLLLVVVLPDGDPTSSSTPEEPRTSGPASGGPVPPAPPAAPDQAPSPGDR